MRYAYPCLIERDVEEHETTGRDAYVITFRDVPEAISGGWSWPEALAMAQDCLDVALSFYTDANQDLPTPSALRDGEVLISTTPTVAAKLALYTAMRAQGITPDAIAEALSLDERAAQRLLDLRYRTHLTTMQRALAVVGRALVVEDWPVAMSPTNSQVD